MIIHPTSSSGSAVERPIEEPLDEHSGPAAVDLAFAASMVQLASLGIDDLFGHQLFFVFAGHAAPWALERRCVSFLDPS